MKEGRKGPHLARERWDGCCLGSLRFFSYQLNDPAEALIVWKAGSEGLLLCVCADLQPFFHFLGSCLAVF